MISSHEITSAPAILTADFLQSVIALSERSGRLLVQEFSLPQGPRGSGSHADVDEEIEWDLRRDLLALLPCHWLGEETGAQEAAVGYHDYCWLVDPHDGTSAFLAGERGTSVSIGLLWQGNPVLGVVHAPMSPDRGSDTIAWMLGMKHLLRNGIPVANDLSSVTKLDGKSVFVSQAAIEWPYGNAALVAPARFISMPSLAYRLARTAVGDAVAGVSLAGALSWDYGAGHALIRGSGGVLIDESGHQVFYSEDGRSSTRWCFGGAPSVVLELSQRDWSLVRKGERLPRRTSLSWPRIANEPMMDRAVACLMGQIAGDSLGSLVEFRGPEDIALQYPHGVRDLADGGTWNTLAGQPTDDSELALDLARTLSQLGAWSSENVVSAYGEWYLSRPFDIGMTVQQSLSAIAKAQPGEKAKQALIAANVDSQANGALMRCSPLGIWARNAAEAAYIARQEASLTHPHPVCQAASAAYVAAISTAISGGDVNAMFHSAFCAVLEEDSEPVRESLTLASQGVGVGDFMDKQGWVLIAFQNAFSHLARGVSLEDALIWTASSGGDTDTNAAICGALLGSFQGRKAIPARWTSSILACRPFKGVSVHKPRQPRYWPDDVPLIAESLLKRRLG